MRKTPSPDALQAFPTPLPSKPTARSAGLIPQLEKTLRVWKERCQRTRLQNLLQLGCLFLQIPAQLPEKCCWRGVCVPGCPAPLPPGVQAAGVCVEPGKTEGIRSKPALTAPSQGRRGEALLDTSSNNQNRYYCSPRMEKQTFLLWAGTKTPEWLLIPLISGVLAWRGLCIQVFVIQAPQHTFRLGYVVTAIFFLSLFSPLSVKGFSFPFL